MRTIVLDRDGVLTENSSDPNSPLYYILRKEDLQLKPGVKEAVARLKGRVVVLATRQKCVAKGLISGEAATAINEHLEQLLDFKFDDRFMQTDGDDKRDIFYNIAERYGRCVVVDDKEYECRAAQSCQMDTICTGDLPSVIDQLLAE